MVLAVDRIGGDVAGAVLAAYARLGGTVVETTLSEISEIEGIPGRVVVAADLGIAECLLLEGTDPAHLVPGIERLAAVGWEVTLVSPAARMGEAHRALRGSPARLQAWWREGDQLCFGVPEVP